MIFASNGGAPRDPAWVGNLRAEAHTRIEVRGETIDVDVDVVAKQVTGEERERQGARDGERH